jgi:hypothetical protein
VVLLDQHRVEQSDAVIRAAAHAHGVFLRETQPGQGFARVDYPGARPRDGIDVAPRRGRDCREGLQEVERGAFGSQQRARRSAQGANLPSGFDLRAFLHLPCDFDARVQAAKARIEPGPAADYGGGAADDARSCRARRRDEARSPVAAADIFTQGSLDVRCDS